MTDLVLLAAFWVIWCGLHSLLARPTVTAKLKRLSCGFAGYYRFCYNLFACITLLPYVFWQWQRVAGPALLSWTGPWRLLQGAAWLAAGLLAWGGVRSYPLPEFLGFPPAAVPTPPPPPLMTTGVLGIVRHPWYLAGLLILWTRDLDRADLLTAVLLSLYLFLGAHWEEQRLFRTYGQAYGDYRRQVAGWIPWLAQILRFLHRRSKRPQD